MEFYCYFFDIFAKIPDKEKVELIGSLVKEVLFDGLNHKVGIQLRHLPDVWQDAKTLEGVFYYRSAWGPQQDNIGTFLIDSKAINQINTQFALFY